MSHRTRRLLWLGAWLVLSCTLAARVGAQAPASRAAAQSAAATPARIHARVCALIAGRRNERTLGFGLLALDDLNGDESGTVACWVRRSEPEAGGGDGDTPLDDLFMQCMPASGGGSVRWARLLPKDADGVSLGLCSERIGDLDGDKVSDILCDGSMQGEDALVALSGASGKVIETIGLHRRTDRLSRRVAVLQHDHAGELWVAAGGRTGRFSGFEYPFSESLVAIAAGTRKTVWVAEEDGIFGSTIADAGDVNGDGMDDLVARVGCGIYGSNPSQTDGLRILSGADGSTLRELGPQAEIQPFEHIVICRGGDMDRDGVSDLVVAHGGNPVCPERMSGGLYALSSKSGRILWRLRPGAKEGTGIESLLTVPDMTGDGLDEIVFGMPGDRHVGGQCVIVSGDGEQLAVVSGGAPGDSFGESMCRLRDAAGEGEGVRIAVGAPGADEMRGALFLLEITPVRPATEPR